MITSDSLVLDVDDVAYVKEVFVPITLLARAYGWDTGDLQIARETRQIPAATYVLPDGTAMVPPDYFALVGRACDVASLRDRFMTRIQLAAALYGISEYMDFEEKWSAYMDGHYGACLKETSPEAVATKAAYVRRIEEMLSPEVGSEKWRQEMRDAVNGLDSLERPFAKADRQRFGATTRDRLITAVREKYGLEN